jgi:hypothetical protein
MPSSFSASLRFEEQLTGENLNTWGVKLSNTLARVDDAIAGYVAIAISGDTTLTSSNSNTAADQARMAHLKFTGSPAANASITVPAVSKAYWIWNATAKVLTFTTGSGNTSTVEAGDIVPIWCDGTNVKSQTYGGYNLKDFINAQTAAAGAVPGTVGNLGKFLKVTVDGSAPTWQALSVTDFSNYNQLILGVQVALAVAL